MKFLLSLFFVLAATNAQAGSKTGTLKATIVENHQAYKLVENKTTEVLMELSERKSVTHFNMDGEEQTQTVTALPRKEKGEFDTITIKKVSDTKVLVINDTVTFVDSAAGELKFVLRTEGEAELTRGTWTDLQNNLDVEITMTKKGKAAIEKQTADYTSRMIETETKIAVKKQTGMDVDVSANLKLKYNSVVFGGTLQRLAANPTGTMSGKVTLRW